MRFTHLDILEQCFREKFRGYSSQEVDTFLQLVANDFKEMEEEIKNLQIELHNKKLEIEKLEKDQIGIFNVTNSAGGISAEAIRNKAREIILFAREKAEQHKVKSDRELFKIREEIKNLKEAKKFLIKNLEAGSKDYLQALKTKITIAKPDNVSKNKKN